jgi:Nucleotidyltransferase domain
MSYGNSLVYQRTEIHEDGFITVCPPRIDQIRLDREELRELWLRSYVRGLDLFGSAARGDFDPEHSNVDFLWSSIASIQTRFRSPPF